MTSNWFLSPIQRSLASPNLHLLRSASCQMRSSKITLFHQVTCLSSCWRKEAMGPCTLLKMSTHIRSTLLTWISSPQAIPNSRASSKTAKTRIKPSRLKKELLKRTICSKKSLWRTKQKICVFLKWAPSKNNSKHLYSRRLASNTNKIEMTVTHRRLNATQIRIWPRAAALKKLKSR